ncbi:MAG: cell division FtsA domain-containing protein [Candidatus Gracilibacteria bacterium]|jgi:cell division protein FtsA|nr:cell division FtsA domain-containing protein [Candidatus Gracilibacteria bacterium]
MNIFRRIRNRVSDTHFLALDIGTESVKASIVEPEGKRGKIIGYAKENQKLFDMQSGTITDISSVILNCQKAISKAENMAGVSTRKMVLGVSGEIVHGATFSTSFVRRDPSAKIDMSELKHIIQKVQWKAFDEIRSQMSFETGYNELDVRLVNASIVDTSIDGYRVTNPIGFQGKVVNMTLFNSFSPLVFFGTIQTIAAEIDKEIMALSSMPFALCTSLFEEEKQKISAIFIDVGAGSTDIGVVRDGVVKGTRMFTIGGRTFSKRLSKALNISYYDAEQIKLSYSNDKLERQSHRIIREALKNDVDVWLSGVVLSLEYFKDEEENLPSKILLSGGAASLPEIKEALETREWVKSLPFDKKPQISFYNPKLVPGISFDYKIFNDHSDIMSIALAKNGLSLISEDALSTKVLKKVVRLMQM